jgi:hypothetical protein
MLVYGLLLVVVITFLPHGIVDTIIFALRRSRHLATAERKAAV